MTDLVDLVERSLGAGVGEQFRARVDDQAAFLRGCLADGRLDNDDFAIGLELEVYAVTDGGRLATLPEDVFAACNKELGLHNAELNTDPDPFTADGIADQHASLADQWQAARTAAADADRDLVLDSMWTIPPAAGGVAYLSATERRDGLVVPSNMRLDPRYCAIDRDILQRAGGSLSFDVPGATVEFPSILFESLATSIQPHVQIPDADSFPTYYNAGIRTLGPVLALGTNSPFLPPDFYDDDLDPRSLLTDTHHELRIAAFEQSVNATDPPKVRVPDDIGEAVEVVDNVVDDPLIAPFLSEWLDEGGEDDGDDAADEPAAFADNYPEFDHKRSTYWRWLRCVVGGDPVPGISDEESLRIEYRPIPTQPTIHDIVGFQCLVGGLLRGLVVTDHPLADLPWQAAEDAFYEAVEHGLAADLAWVTADGERTDDPAVVYDELFSLARRGLREQDVDDETIETYLGPLEARWAARTTPSQWKIDRVREELDDGADLHDAIVAMQREYVRLSREHDTFADWL